MFHKLCSVSGNLHRSQIGECYNAPTFKDSITPDFTPDFSWESHEKNGGGVLLNAVVMRDSPWKFSIVC